jgi:hypothetical protein
MGKVYMVQAILRLPAEMVESQSLEEWAKIIGQSEAFAHWGSMEDLTYELVAEFLYFSWVGDTGYYIAEETDAEFYDQVDDSIRVWEDNEVGLPSLEEGFSVGEAKVDPAARYVR